MRVVVFLTRNSRNDSQTGDSCTDELKDARVKQGGELACLESLPNRQMCSQLYRLHCVENKDKYKHLQTCRFGNVFIEY